MLVRLNTDFPLFCISLVSGPVEVHVVMLRHTGDNTGVTVTVFRRFTDCLVVGKSSKRKKKYRDFFAFTQHTVVDFSTRKRPSPL